MIDPLLLSTLLSSKVCHDISSSIAVVNQALEMLDGPIDEDSRVQFDQLLRNSSGEAVAKIEFLRYAFGSQGLSSGQADMGQAKRITEAYVAIHRPTLDWQLAGEPLSYSQVRLAMNMVMIAIESLPRGGVITVKAENGPDGSLTLSVSGAGDRPAQREDLVAALRGEPPEEGWTARSIQPLWAREIAGSLGSALSHTISDAEIRLSASGLKMLQNA